jgi:hypothetical protein
MFARENFKAGIAARIDLSDEELKQHEIALQIQTMF